MKNPGTTYHTGIETSGKAPWSPISLVGTIRRFGLSRQPARSFVLVWALCTVACVTSGMLTSIFEWYGIPVSLGPIDFSLTIYPPFIICLLLLFWLGLEWAVVPAFLSSLSVAIYSGMAIPPAILFALADPLTFCIYALAYASLPVTLDLRRINHFVSYILITVVATLAGSAGAFIAGYSYRLSPVETVNIWQGW